MCGCSGKMVAAPGAVLRRTTVRRCLALVTVATRMAARPPRPRFHAAEASLEFGVWLENLAGNWL